jgi:hypothetical protein
MLLNHNDNDIGDDAWRFADNLGEELAKNGYYVVYHMNCSSIPLSLPPYH